MERAAAVLLPAQQPSSTAAADLADSLQARPRAASCLLLLSILLRGVFTSSYWRTAVSKVFKRCAFTRLRKQDGSPDIEFYIAPGLWSCTFSVLNGQNALPGDLSKMK